MAGVGEIGYPSKMGVSPGREASPRRTRRRHSPLRDISDSLSDAEFLGRIREAFVAQEVRGSGAWPSDPCQWSVELPLPSWVPVRVPAPKDLDGGGLPFTLRPAGPVKAQRVNITWALVQALGVPRESFITPEAVRVFQRRGFRVFNEGEPIEPPRGARLRSLPAASPRS